MKRLIFVMLFLSVLTRAAHPLTSPPGPLTVSTTNPRYFVDPNGKIVFLAGSHTWSNGMEDRGTISSPPPFDFTRYVAFMAAHGFNWMRLWTSENTHAPASDDPDETVIAPPYKWQRSSTCCANDGGNKFDFNQLDQAYFDRMRARVIQAGASGIYVSVQLFNAYMWTNDATSNDGNPFLSSNNVNSINCSGTCPSDAGAIPTEAWNYEKAYLAKVVDTVHDLPNVMYEVANEAYAPTAANATTWENKVISYVNTYEQSTYGSHHPIGFTSEDYRIASDSTLYKSAADWVSPATKLPPEATGQCPTVTGNGGAANPSSPNCKVVINDTDHSYYWVNLKNDGPTAQVNWVWENFARGNGVGFMDPYLVLGSGAWAGRNNCTGAPVGGDPRVCSGLSWYWDPMRSAIADIRTYANKIDLLNMIPHSSLSTSGYALANPGYQYLVFNPNGSSSFTVTFCSSTCTGTYKYEWFNTSTHAVDETGLVIVGTSHSFTPPSSANHTLWLYSSARPNAPTGLTGAVK